MTEIQHSASSERLDPKAFLPASEMTVDPLVSQWLSLHQESTVRDTKDNQANNDAQKLDAETIAGRSAHTVSSSDKIKSDREDLAGDVQAIGKHKGQPGDDQNNRDADMKIVGLDREVLSKYGGELSGEQKQAITDDIQAKSKTAHNSNTDIAQENKYIQGDKSEIAALNHGSVDQIETANQKQIELHKQDAQLESGYINDNNRSIKADAKVLALFGNLTLSR